MCAQGAMNSGAGLVTLGIPSSLANPIIKIKPKEVMLLPLAQTKDVTLSLAAFKRIKDFIKNIDVIALGPGLTQNSSAQGLIRKVIAKINKPMIIDADGLNALVGHLGLLTAARSGGHNATRIVTPHPGEMARLFGCTVKKIQSNRELIAKKFAKDYSSTVVLKGYRTVVADPGGKVYINKTGNPGMATAGSGDVLTGIIAAFLGQGLNVFEAAKSAVYSHGLAGDLAAKEKSQISMVASDIIAKIPEAIKRCS